MVAMKDALIGEKLGHSISPQVHQIIFKELGLNNSYELIELQPDQVADFLATAGKEYTGLNVTIPYKMTVMEGLKGINKEAAAIGAVNTIYFKNNAGYGFNTDYLGLGRTLDHNAIKLPGKKVVILGNGGAAKAVLQAVLDRNAQEILVVARNVERAKAKLHNFVERANNLSFVDYATFKENPRGNVMINATPVGMFPKVGVAAVSADEMAGYEAAVDVIYNPLETQFLAQAREAGCKTCNGIYMLIAQAVAAEEIWLERKLPDSLIDKIETELRKEAIL